MNNKNSRSKYHAAPLTKTLLASTIASILWVPHTMAQAPDAPQTEAVEEVIVTGIRQTFRTSAAIKRQSPTIVDAMTSAELGALPDLSVAESLERITGVTGDRFKGNASEISIRGLGPFLGSSTFNGRQISSGSGNRAVAFSQFPSELVNGLVVYKAQTAEILEGGVSGVVDLRTIRPLDYGKQRFQAELKGNYNPYQAKLHDENGWGHRESVSYTDQFDTDIGAVGVAVGYAGGVTSSPEESYNTSSTLRNCNSDYTVDGGSNCSFSDSNAAANGGAAADGDYYFIPNLTYLRQMESKEDRDAIITAVQWQPNDDWDINFDAQWSEREYFEDRHDLYLDDGRRRIADWTTDSDHVLQSYSGNSRVSSYGEYRVRGEEYKGAGLNVKWQATPNLVLKADLAMSDTERFQTRHYTRFRSDRVDYDWVNRGSDTFPSIQQSGAPGALQASVQDMSFFDYDSQARNYRFDIEDSIDSFNLDGIYSLDSGFFTKVKAGIALSSREHNTYDEDENTFSPASGDRAGILAAVIANCSEPFGQKDYGDDAKSTFNTWATYDTECAYSELVGSRDMSVDPKTPSAGDVNLTEDISSLFALAEFETELGSVPVTGNLGVRYVNTSIESVGIRTAYSVTTDTEGVITFNELSDTNEFTTYKNDYTNVLPSINVNFGLSDDVQLRLAAYGAMSRPDMWYYGAARDISPADDEEYTSVAEALSAGSVSAVGNPNLEALKSDNYDASVTWYANDDTTISGAIYYKTFNARLGDVTSPEDIVVDGQTYNVEVGGLPQILDDSSSIQGFELSASHIFDYLPGPLDTLGISGSYNYADSSYESVESATDITDDVRALLPAANLPGLSKHSYNAQLFWEKNDFSARIAYKFRSEYLKPFGADLTQNNRVVGDSSSVDLDFSYKLADNLKLKLQVINATNEAYVEQRVVTGQYSRIEYSGPRYFVGLQFRM